jgi:hypothetical protein
MWKKSKATHTKLGFIPELNYVLLKDNSTHVLELWTQSKGLTSRAINLDGIELEFVRECKRAVKVIDNEFNRENCPDDIGRIYVDQAPSRAYVLELG